MHFSVKIKLQLLAFIMFWFLSPDVLAQDISLYQQFNGRYDFVFFGNTMNTVENGLTANCTILTQSSAALALSPGNQIIKAYLYWAGSGSGDFNVKLNGQDIAAERTFSVTQLGTTRQFFSAFTDVTAQVLATGSGNYTLSDLDVSAVIAQYCPNGTNFAGWAIVVVYENPALPLNQLNVYDGLQRIPSDVNITLDNLNVIDNVGAKIGFVAWEGDRFIDDSERLFFNEHIVGNPPLNPSDNAFNGTNSFTGATNLYNMDLDVYDIQGFITIGDTLANIRLTSGQDFVMINTVVSKLNSQLPDATVVVDHVEVTCDSRKILVDYTVSNFEATQQLPALVRIAFYADGALVHTQQTQNIIPIGGSETGQASVVIPDNIPDNFELRLVVDDNGLGVGGVTELIETNNSFTIPVDFKKLPDLNPLDPLYSCNLGLGKGLYDFSDYADIVTVNADDVASFHETLEDAELGTNAIINTSNYTANATPKDIFIRVSNASCYTTTSFQLLTRNCPPTIYNFISANGDMKNEEFFIDGLRDIFVNFKLSVYNRWGKLIWTGNNASPFWTGKNNEGYIPDSGLASDGTYYYILELNDPDYPQPLAGFLYYMK